MADKKIEIINQLIEIGSILYQKNLAVGRSGNLSAKLDDNKILISAQGTTLGFLKKEDFLVVDLEGKPEEKSKKFPSSEVPIHTEIYKNLKTGFVIHAHPPITSAYFAVNDFLEPVTFETKLYLGNVPVIYQDTPAVTKLTPVIEALKISNIVVLKNHGSISIANNSIDALLLMEELEVASNMSYIFLFLSSKSLTGDKCVQEEKKVSGESFEMFSSQHIQRIVDLANQDQYIKEKGEELDLTTQVVIKLDEANLAYKFVFEKGSVKKIDNDFDAPFIISGKEAIWRLIFEGKLDPFVATTQGKLKLKGDFGKISKWYAPFNRLFIIFKQVGIK